MFSLPPIPPQSHSLAPLSESHLLKIELLRLATVVVKSIPPSHLPETSRLEWLHNELEIHTKESQQHMYPTFPAFHITIVHTHTISDEGQQNQKTKCT